MFDDDFDDENIEFSDDEKCNICGNSFYEVEQHFAYEYYCVSCFIENQDMIMNQDFLYARQFVLWR